MARRRRLIPDGLLSRAHDAVRRVDRRAAHLAAAGAADRLTATARRISKLGGSKAVVTIAAAATVADVVLRRRSARWWHGPAFMTAAVGGQFAISNVVKLVVRRKRPDVLRLAGSSGSSFPSGHSMASAASYGAAAVLLTRGRSPTARLAGAVAAGGTAVAVGTTRVVLGVHWTSDVLAGLALGWGWLAATSLVAIRRWRRRAG